MICSHLGMVWSLIRLMVPVRRTSVLSSLAGVRFGLGSMKVLFIAVKILGRVLVSMLLSIRCSCTGMFSYVARLVLGFPRSRCRPNSLCAFAVLLGLVE